MLSDTQLIIGWFRVTTVQNGCRSKMVA